MNWSALPDVIAIALLILAFASTARRNYSPTARLWLIAWLMIALHFVASLFNDLSGGWGEKADILAIVALTWAGVLFQTAVIPYKKEPSRRWMTLTLLTANTLYLTLLLTSGPKWAWTLAAALFGLGPLAITLIALPNFRSKYRWATLTLNLLLSHLSAGLPEPPGQWSLSGAQCRDGDGLSRLRHQFLLRLPARHSRSLHHHRRLLRPGPRSLSIGPWLFYSFPKVHVESEVWNLPKFIVAVGMILMLLEDQIEHNKHLALHDPLTGLPNRRLFEDRLSSALDRARRTDAQMALLIVDLNRFKQVNDSFGHHVGDLLLQRVSTIFVGRVRRSDTVARTGGDEFSIILEEPANRAEAKHVSQALLELLYEPMQLENQTVRIGASIGVAVFPEDASEIESLCIVADKRMYEEKMRRAAQSLPESAPLAKPLLS